MKNTTTYTCSEYSSYTMGIEEVEKMVIESKLHKELCKKTMPKELFEFMEERKEFGVQYFSCST